MYQVLSILGFCMPCFLHLGFSGHWLFFVVDDSVSFRSQFRHQHLSAAFLDWSRSLPPILSLVFYFPYSHRNECEVTVIYGLLLIYFHPTRMWTPESGASLCLRHASVVVARLKFYWMNERFRLTLTSYCEYSPISLVFKREVVW